MSASETSGFGASAYLTVFTKGSGLEICMELLMVGFVDCSYSSAFLLPSKDTVASFDLSCKDFFLISSDTTLTSRAYDSVSAVMELFA